eukprot:4205245-Amphidinium_carterae.1
MPKQPVATSSDVSSGPTPDSKALLAMLAFTKAKADDGDREAQVIYERCLPGKPQGHGHLFVPGEREETSEDSQDRVKGIVNLKGLRSQVKLIHESLDLDRGTDITLIPDALKGLHGSCQGHRLRSHH